ncbi:MAG: hypothetical protein KDD25_01780, partial [Bdellovibrionales bacterium]|nr:hypothetical protein [Bdellovibrionales bacterium]
MRKLIPFLILFIFSIPWTSEARVFSFEKATFGNYLRGNYGLSFANQDSYANSSGWGLDFDKTPTYNLGGEFGFVINSEYLGLRFGAHVISPENIFSSKGEDDAGDTVMEVNSHVSAIFGVGYLEFYFF